MPFLFLLYITIFINLLLFFWLNCTLQIWRKYFSLISIWELVSMFFVSFFFLIRLNCTCECTRKGFSLFKIKIEIRHLLQLWVAINIKDNLYSYVTNFTLARKKQFFLVIIIEFSIYLLLLSYKMAIAMASKNIYLSRNFKNLYKNKFNCFEIFRFFKLRIDSD